MTHYRYSLAAMLLGLPLCASSLELRNPPVQAMVVVPMAAVPAEPVEERPPTARLRDSLRQPLTEGDEAAKPYHLTPEERQRLREQLRGQQEQATRSQ